MIRTRQNINIFQRETLSLSFQRGVDVEDNTREGGREKKKKREVALLNE
jgi:hypothetical protein